MYQTLCASCHHERRQGRTGSPLLPLFLRRTKDAALERIIGQGKPGTLMPAFPHLKASEKKALVAFLRTPEAVSWTKADIEASLTTPSLPAQRLSWNDRREITALVERGKQAVWLLEGLEKKATFPASNVHGGLKFSPDQKRLYIPSRDGGVTQVHLDEGRIPAKIRACIYLRNLALSSDGRLLVAACWLPRALILLDATTLRLKRILPLEGQISAIYTLPHKNQAVFTFQDRPLVGLLDTTTQSFQTFPIPSALEDFFLDPFGRYLIGGTRRQTILHVIDLLEKRLIFQAPLPGIPHLFSAALWYDRGAFYFALPHLQKPFISLWRMYKWRWLRTIPLKSPSSFLRTHPEVPAIWADQGSDQMALIDKRTFAVTFFRPEAKKKVLHTEFSAEGRLAYLSLFENDGALLAYDAISLQRKLRLPASWPVGKYNLDQKRLSSQKRFWGYEVFRQHCWGCHHPTHTAFAPSFASIAKKRHPSWIRAQILDPKTTSKALGYAHTSMPALSLSPEEIEAVLAFLLAHASPSNDERR